VVRAVFRKAGSILSGSQDVTRGRVKTLDWRPRGGQRRTSAERLRSDCVDRSAAQKSQSPLRELWAAQRTPDTAFRGRFEGSAQKVYFTQGTDRFSHHQWCRYHEGPLSVGSDLKWERDKSSTRPFSSLLQ
jgi:hypothetical protein